MATKTISITVKAYQLLKERKEKKESFSDVIVRSFPKYSIKDLIGVLNKEETKELKKNIKERRCASRKRSEKIKEALQ